MPTSIDYTLLAATYAQHRRVHPEVLRCLLDAVGPESRILEVGCGTGNYLVAICDAVGCHGCGIDPSAEMLAEARAQNSQLQLARDSAEDLDFPPATPL